jgi:hypothetical protein
MSETKAAYLREWRKNNKEKNKEYDRKYRQKSVDKRRERDRTKYYIKKETETEEDRLKRKEYKKQYYLKNKERLSENMKSKHSLNRDRDNKRSRLWRIANPEQYKSRLVDYYQKNKEVILSKLKEETQKKQNDTLNAIICDRKNLVRSPLWEGYSYDPESGELIREFYNSGNRKIGVIGNRSNGYLIFGKNCRYYRVNRIAYEIMTNQKIPIGKVIDHINGIKTDNSWSNLRLTTPRGNSQNKEIHRQGRLVGYTFDKKRQLYVAQISINQKNKRLGYFTSELKAHQAYMQACDKIGEFR